MLAYDVELLILGAGWSSTFLLSLCRDHNITVAATSRSPTLSSDQISFSYDPASDDPSPFRSLPRARTVLITFPLKVPGASRNLVKMYLDTHPGSDCDTHFVQLGSTGIWDAGSVVDSRSTAPTDVWRDRHSPLNPTNERGLAENEFLALFPTAQITVLNLAGLWGGVRKPATWVDRVAPTKEKLKIKGSLHAIHGHDVARAVIAIHSQFHLAAGQRWLLTDGRVYDWWDLASAWSTSSTHSTTPSSAGVSLPGSGTASATPSKHAKWVRELLREEGIPALPRPVEFLRRALDSREFWETFGLEPIWARVQGADQ